MKYSLCLRLQALSIASIISCAALAQTSHDSVQNRPADSEGKPPVEILSFKISTDYYPMLDHGRSIFTADNPDLPTTEIEKRTGQTGSQTTRRRGIGTQMESSKAQGKLRSQIKVISEANAVNVAFRNIGTKPIKTIEWDFAFPRYIEGQMVLRYDVSSKVEIKPGGKKTLKHPLPLGATRCKVIDVSTEDNKQEKTNTSEAVCGPGVHDPSHLKQETVTVKRIEYVDGSIWQK